MTKKQLKGWKVKRKEAEECHNQVKQKTSGQIVLKAAKKVLHKPKSVFNSVFIEILRLTGLRTSGCT